MKFNLSALVLVVSTFANALPQVERRDISLLGNREAESPAESKSDELWKRKGGGGGGGKGGGSSSGGSSSSGSSPSSSSGGKGGSSSSGSSSSSSGSSSGSSSTSGSRGGLGSSSSASGGRTTTGSGVQPSYGGGKYYGGGASVPYASGGRSASGISPFFFGGAALGAFAVFPALWLYGVYSYPYSHPYTYHNRTTDRNETKPVECLCEQYSECGCDENGDNSQLVALIGDGTYNGLNKSAVTVADINGTSTILINGTLPNGTTAAGGTESPDAGVALQFSGYWLMMAFVGCTVFLT